MVEIRPLPELPEVLHIQPKKLGDSRGFFMETFRDQWLEAQGLSIKFCQDNQSFSAVKGTLRGLHFQRDPQAQGKLVRCLAGQIWDVAVDIRPQSSTFGKWAALTLTAEMGEQLYIPPGFAHGFLTLEPNCLVAYKCTAYYNQTAEGSIHYADPDLAIAWPPIGAAFALSDKDAAAGSFATYASESEGQA